MGHGLQEADLPFREIPDRVGIGAEYAQDLRFPNEGDDQDGGDPLLPGLGAVLKFRIERASGTMQVFPRRAFRSSPLASTRMGPSGGSSPRARRRPPRSSLFLRASRRRRLAAFSPMAFTTDRTISSRTRSGSREPLYHRVNLVEGLEVVLFLGFHGMEPQRTWQNLWYFTDSRLRLSMKKNPRKTPVQCRFRAKSIPVKNGA
jgi:hypothetical protein